MFRISFFHACSQSHLSTLTLGRDAASAAAYNKVTDIIPPPKKTKYCYMAFHPPEHPDYPSVPPPAAMSQGRNALLHAGYALAKVDLLIFK